MARLDLNDKNADFKQVITRNVLDFAKRECHTVEDAIQLLYRPQGMTIETPTRYQINTR